MLRVGLEHMLASGKIFKPLLLLLTVSKKVIKKPFYVTSANHSALQHAEFVYEAILELVSTNRVVEVAKSHLKIINPLSVSVQSCGKKRLILDLRYVNQHVFKQKFKFEDWRVALDFFEKGCFFTKFDLKSGYHYLDFP